MTVAVGIEIGGTKLQAGVAAGATDERGRPTLRDGRLLSLARTSAEPKRGAKGILESLPSLVADALRQAGCGPGDVSAIGIGFGGPVDSARDRVIRSFHVEGWDGFALGDWARDRWGVPSFAQNDTNAGGLAEAMLGAGRGCRRVFYMNIGTGIGGALVIDARVDEGQGFGACEVGHSYVPDPDTGRAVILERVSSGWSIARRTREALQGGETSAVLELAGGQPDAITARTVHQAAEGGDALALRILDEATDGVATAMCNIVSLMDPERLILGGGVSLMGPLFWDPLRRKVRAGEFGPYSGTYEIVPSGLGEEVVVQGAVLLALQRGASTGR